MQTKEQQQVVVINALYSISKAISNSHKEGMKLISETAELLALVSGSDAKNPTIQQLKALQKIKDIFNKSQTCSTPTSIKH